MAASSLRPAMRLPSVTSLISTATKQQQRQQQLPRQRGSRVVRGMSSKSGRETGQRRQGSGAGPPKTSIAERGATSTEETQTDFASLDVLRSLAPPATAVESCSPDGFRLNNEVEVRGRSGVLLVDGEGFVWRPWLAQGPAMPVTARRQEDNDEDDGRGGGRRLLNRKGQFDVADTAWGLLGMVWPKPDLLILGTGARLSPLAPSARRFLNQLGVRVEVQDTRNAAAQFNILATERGTQQVAAALVPIGWKDS